MGSLADDPTSCLCGTGHGGILVDRGKVEVGGNEQINRGETGIEQHRYPIKVSPSAGLCDGRDMWPYDVDRLRCNLAVKFSSGPPCKLLNMTGSLSIVCSLSWH